MGIERNAAALLLKLRDEGVHFDRTLTLGRQTPYLEPREYARALQRAGAPPVPMPAYADDFFRALGAAQIDSVDASSFEGATLVHDLNLPIPVEWHQQFDVVFDGGTLEHIFDVRTALRNVMQALKAGGHFVGVSPLNSWCGHGFYQFSPELFWRTFSPDNGFSVVGLYAADGRGACYAVADPAVVKSRVELCTASPVSLMVHARRDAVRDILLHAPQQSDYASAWNSETTSPQPRSRWKTLPVIRDLLQARRHVRYLHQRSFQNRTFYTPVDLRL